MSLYQSKSSAVVKERSRQKDCSRDRRRNRLSVSIHKVNVGVAIVGVAVANSIKMRLYIRSPDGVAIVVVTVGRRNRLSASIHKVGAPIVFNGQRRFAHLLCLRRTSEVRSSVADRRDN